MKPIYKTEQESYEDFLEYARGLSAEEIQRELRDRTAFHSWAVRAYETALEEKAKA